VPEWDEATPERTTVGVAVLGGSKTPSSPARETGGSL